MTEPILQVAKLTAGYQGQTIIKDISFDVERGKIYTIIGPNGCGKTTLLRTISRNWRPIAGKVLLDGENIFQMNTRKLAQKMAVLSQNNQTLSDVSVRNLVQYGRFAHKAWWQGKDQEDEATVAWALEKTGTVSFSERRINTLSGGERQRAWIAMSLAQKPEILLLDEPTTYLDISHQLEIMDLVRRLNQEEKITIVMVLHDINHAARFSDQLIVLKDQHIYELGDPWTILQGDVLEKVFRVRSKVITDEESNTPIFYAKEVIR